MWLRNLIGWKQILSSGLFVIGRRYESRAGVETGRQQDGGSVI
jgi:hypothetical protein